MNDKTDPKIIRHNLAESIVDPEGAAAIKHQLDTLRADRRQRSLVALVDASPWMAVASIFAAGLIAELGALRKPDPVEMGWHPDGGWFLSIGDTTYTDAAKAMDALKREWPSLRPHDGGRNCSGST